MLSCLLIWEKNLGRDKPTNFVKFIGWLGKQRGGFLFPLSCKIFIASFPYYIFLMRRQRGLYMLCGLSIKKLLRS